MALQFKSSLVDSLTVLSLTGWTEYKMSLRLDSGELLAWNLGMPDSSRQLLRISADSLLCHMDGQPPPIPETIFNRVFPENFAPTARQVSRKLLIGPDLVLDLMRAGILRAVPGTHCRSGNGGSPKLVRSSVLAFLKSRRLN